ncbi:hypothetical protein SOMG_00236 [Schizosaccharomyces osmophilus]|uniref:Uncharacterized protein n=1 Tax=Schizosaccharomyces osmophilus TaxID=2545709 RepID=A0AAF0AUT0_9SCHI|nr:uncharacterized protein SOMG_00236 [Schizosaccharomyces osmophilus]WBW71209.1 hypothetical protein SOMG_00236 [Schizosaccharomyces osmophilus]
MDSMKSNTNTSSSSLVNNAPSKPTVTTSGAQWYQPKPPGMWYVELIPLLN